MKQMIGSILLLGLLGCSAPTSKAVGMTVASYSQPAYSCSMHPDVVTNDAKGTCVVCQMTTDKSVKPPAGMTHNLVLSPGGHGPITLTITQPDQTRVEVPLTDRGDYYSRDLTLQGRGHFRFEAKSSKGLLAATGTNL